MALRSGYTLTTKSPVSYTHLFGTYQTSEYEAVTNAIKVMKITHADALKLEGGGEIIDAVKKIIAAGIPIMLSLIHI